MKDFENSKAYKPNCNVEDFLIWLNITKKGEEIFHKSVNKVNKISNILSGQLMDEEKTELFRILKNLN